MMSPLFWSFKKSFVVGLFSFVRAQKNEKKGTSFLLHNCVDVGLCRRTFRERERERKRETNSISNSSNNNNNNNKRCFLSLYSLLLV